MKYGVYQDEGGWYASIETSTGVDRRDCASKEEAETIRDNAAKAGLLRFDPFDRDGDGKPGGSVKKGSAKKKAAD